MVRVNDNSNSLNELDSFLAYKQLKNKSPNSFLSIIKGIMLIFLALGLAISDFIIWPYIGYGIIMVNLWAISTSWLIFTKPKKSVQYWNVALGTLFLNLPIIGALEIYQEGTGGQLGEILFGNFPKLGIAMCLLLAIFSLYVIIPKKLTSSCIKLTRWIMWSYSRSLPVVLKIYITSKLIVKKSFQVCKKIYVITYTVASFIYRNYPKFPLHKTLTTPIKFFIEQINSRNLRDIPVNHQQQDQTIEFQQKKELTSDVIDNNEDSNLIEHDAFKYHSEESYYHNETENLEEVNGYVEDTESPLGEISQSFKKANWNTPPLEILRVIEKRWVSEEENKETARKIETAMKEYNIEVTVDQIRPGPVVTQYGLIPGWIRKYKDEKVLNTDGSYTLDDKGKPITSKVEEKTRIKVSSVLARENDLALTLAASSLRFEAPVPGENFIGLEVPNSQASLVNLRSILESRTFQEFKKTAELPVALGQGSGGEPIVADLTEMPHLLIAGATGSGKSVCMNTMICSLLMEKTPLEVQMYMIDPKRVELTPYEGLPHLSGPVLVEVEDSVPTLKSILAEMQARYKKFAKAGARNIVTYNKKFSDQSQKMPYILVIIDELADLMMTAPGEVESTLARLAQLGRATGIHLVIATQRPSVDVLTGLIKANIPSRISFAVASQIDSRTILDGGGAEKLLGKGDMLYLPGNAPKPKRLQGGFISDEEVQDIVAHWNQQHGIVPKFIIPSSKISPVNTENHDPLTEMENIDKDLAQAINLVKTHSRISASLIQRKLGIGFTKASDLLNKLESKGLVESGDPGKSRKVIITGN